MCEGRELTSVRKNCGRALSCMYSTRRLTIVRLQLQVVVLEGQKVQQLFPVQDDGKSVMKLMADGSLALARVAAMFAIKGDKYCTVRVTMSLSCWHPTFEPGAAPPVLAVPTEDRPILLGWRSHTASTVAGCRYQSFYCIKDGSAANQKLTT
jgi:hypothetical protein